MFVTREVFHLERSPLKAFLRVCVSLPAILSASNNDDMSVTRDVSQSLIGPYLSTVACLVAVFKYSSTAFLIGQLRTFQAPQPLPSGIFWKAWVPVSVVKKRIKEMNFICIYHCPFIGYIFNYVGRGKTLFPCCCFHKNVKICSRYSGRLGGGPVITGGPVGTTHIGRVDRIGTAESNTLRQIYTKNTRRYKKIDNTNHRIVYTCIFIFWLCKTRIINL